MTKVQQSVVKQTVATGYLLSVRLCCNFPNINQKWCSGTINQDSADTLTSLPRFVDTAPTAFTDVNDTEKKASCVTDLMWTAGATVAAPRSADVALKTDLMPSRRRNGVKLMALLMMVSCGRDTEESENGSHSCTSCCSDTAGSFTSNSSRLSAESGTNSNKVTEPTCRQTMIHSKLPQWS